MVWQLHLPGTHSDYTCHTCKDLHHPGSSLASHLGVSKDLPWLLAATLLSAHTYYQ